MYCYSTYFPVTWKALNTIEGGISKAAARGLCAVWKQARYTVAAAASCCAPSMASMASREQPVPRRTILLSSVSSQSHTASFWFLLVHDQHLFKKVIFFKKSHLVIRIFLWKYNSIGIFQTPGPQPVAFEDLGCCRQAHSTLSLTRQAAEADRCWPVWPTLSISRLRLL